MFLSNVDLLSPLFGELFSLYKFPGNEIPIVHGSALSASQETNDDVGKNAILKLMDTIIVYITEAVRMLDKHFSMVTEDVFSIQVFIFYNY